MSILHKVLGLCEHKWEVVKHGPILENEHTKLVMGHYYECRCEKCGKMKLFTLK